MTKVLAEAASASLFRQPDLRFFIAARMAAAFALQMQGVAIGWYVYAATGDPMSLGYVALAQFLPAILLVLATGHAADSFDRRRVAAACFAAQAVVSLALLSALYASPARLGPVYALAVVIGAARAFSQPALAALLPGVVSREAFPRAVSLSSSSLQLAFMAGPAAGGLLFVVNGPALFAVAAALNAAAAWLIMRIAAPAAPSAPAGSSTDEGWSRLIAGFSFLRGNPLVLGAISLDLFAVLLGGVTALLPIFAHDILIVGPAGLGLLRSAPAVGAAAAGFALAWRPLRRNVGTIMLASVAAYGLATIAFALSQTFWLSLAAMAAFGGFDMVSVVLRQTIVQLGTPETMRGRVSAINHMFIGASNQLGDFESSVAAAILGASGAALFGGVGTLLVVAAWAWRFPQLRRADRPGGS